MACSAKTFATAFSWLSFLAVLGACTRGGQMRVGVVDSPVPLTIRFAQRLVPGDYTNGGRGFFRHVIVSDRPTIAYDVWRAAPNGGFEHLSFVLISPVRQPVESNDYRVVLPPGTLCGHAALHLYESGGQVHWSILTLRIGKTWQPLGSAGEPLSEESFRNDRAWIAKLRQLASSASFYDTLSPTERAQLSEGIPNCGSATTRGG
jgi:hypothetical protein